MTELFDTHFHCGEAAGDENYRNEAGTAGVKYLLAAGADFESSKRSREFAENSGNAWFAAGVHPHDASAYTSGIAMFDEFREHPKLVATGEIGLDYYYENSEKKAQRKVFEMFLEAALRDKMPAIIHCRDRDNSYDAYKDAFDMLSDFSRSDGTFVLHCYTGNTSWAEKFMELGAYLGFTGIISFPKAQNVRDVLKMTPIDRILIETDTPYLAPVPYRGKTNHSKYLVEIAKKVSEVKEESQDTIAEKTTKNAINFFRIDLAR